MISSRRCYILIYCYIFYIVFFLLEMTNKYAYGLAKNSKAANHYFLFGVCPSDLISAKCFLSTPMTVPTFSIWYSCARHVLGGNVKWRGLFTIPFWCILKVCMLLLLCLYKFYFSFLHIFEPLTIFVLILSEYYIHIHIVIYVHIYI